MFGKSDNSWVPYVFPFVLFLLLTGPVRFFPHCSPFLYVTKTILVGGLLWIWRHAYAKDLSGNLSFRKTLTAVSCGLLVLDQPRPWNLCYLNWELDVLVKLLLFHKGISWFREKQKLGTLILGVFSLALLFCSPSALALKPDEVLVLANKNVPSGVALAKYYMKKRHIPSNHLLKLRITDKEQCTRDAYETKIAAPLRRYLKVKALEQKIRCLLVMYGLPLKITSSQMNRKERREYKRLKQREKKLQMRLNALINAQNKDHEKIKTKLADLRKRLKAMSKNNQRASLDSEIALVLQKKHPLSGWLPNPFFAGYHQQWLMEKRDTTLLVSRLDGPTPEIVRRIIDDSLAAERSGLKGKAYFDARWPRIQGKISFRGKSGYRFYDTSIYRAADLVKKTGRMPVIVNNKQDLFQPGQCPDTALYCGWYRLGQYVGAFTWTRGSVGYHIASAECSTLKRAGSQVWCKRMLEEGIAATLGPVNEPYVQAFPVPDLFFRFLLDGYWTLAECYALSKPFCSWQMVLIGDPLYRPFKVPK